jgi:hypothetical protein
VKVIALPSYDNNQDSNCKKRARLKSQLNLVENGDHLQILERHHGMVFTSSNDDPNPNFPWLFSMSDPKKKHLSGLQITTF